MIYSNARSYRLATTTALLALALAGCARQNVQGGKLSPPVTLPPNPVIAGWYADPESAAFAGKFWIYPTTSAPYDQQLIFDAFSSKDLRNWTKHPRVLEAPAIAWARRAMWAPAVVERSGKYYFFFAANDIQKDGEVGGIGVAVSDSPAGPFEDLLGKPLIDRFHNGAQPIDQFVFRDTDGTDYMIYGGWGHCNLVRLRPDFTGVLPMNDGNGAGGEVFKEITPAGYVEGPMMFVRGGKYYFMWSEGGWTGPDYRVAYAMADSVQGPFTRLGTVLAQDPAVATGAGHHSVIHDEQSDAWYIVYHRRPLGDKDANHRVVCIEEMRFNDQGLILPVKLTKR